MSKEIVPSGKIHSIEDAINLSRKRLPKLVFDNSLNLSAKCLAKEQSKSGKTGHFRKKCKDAMLEKDLGRLISSFGTAENCGYGVYNGKDAVNQLLIDEGVSNLGHCQARH